MASQPPPCGSTGSRVPVVLLLRLPPRLVLAHVLSAAPSGLRVPLQQQHATCCQPHKHAGAHMPCLTHFTKKAAGVVSVWNSMLTMCRRCAPAAPCCCQEPSNTSTGGTASAWWAEGGCRTAATAAAQGCTLTCASSGDVALYSSAGAAVGHLWGGLLLLPLWWWRCADALLPCTAAARALAGRGMMLLLHLSVTNLRFTGEWGVAAMRALWCVGKHSTTAARWQARHGISEVAGCVSVSASMP
jgi:hypothetical protein